MKDLSKAANLESIMKTIVDMNRKINLRSF